MRKILLTLIYFLFLLLPLNLFAVSDSFDFETTSSGSFSTGTGTYGSWSTNGSRSSSMSGHYYLLFGGSGKYLTITPNSGYTITGFTLQTAAASNGNKQLLSTTASTSTCGTPSGNANSSCSSGIYTLGLYSGGVTTITASGLSLSSLRFDRYGNNGAMIISLTVNYESSGSSYSITYNCDGGTVCPSTVASATTLPNPLPSGLTKSGYAFAGWFTDADKTVAAVAGASIAANTTLYAKWTPTYTVTYNGNGNTGGAAPTDGSSPYTAGSNVTVLGNTGSLVKTGYTFDGWNTAPNGSGINYAVGATISSIAANTTLYAKWVEDSCTDPGLTITLN